MSQMLKLVFFVPEAHVDTVKVAVFNAGAGRQGNYEQCAWQVLGQGQFRPMPGSQPFLGVQGELEEVAEYRVELLCSREQAAVVRDALLASHPYEEPAFEFFATTQI
ncbi:MAG: hypothetical protein ACI9BO_001680 [Zhongshania sp.]|jgi:hypothetical protein